jgi:hypothetical protein
VLKKIFKKKNNKRKKMTVCCLITIITINIINFALISTTKEKKTINIGSVSVGVRDNMILFN